ncbi:MAG: LacI family DNA-binding transcriptional regulator [Bacteroidota bacterium]|nr:LacI family DNA-binding transcriptional regulator [Bacteroidota bacterium]
MKKMNMKELAKELNVSIATVSKALRDSHEISGLTKKKILEMASKLNYTTNPYAGSLRNKKSKTIAVILPEVADSFFSLAINGIQSVAEKKGYHVLIYLSHEKYSNEKSIVGECNSGRVDGVLISISSETTNPDHILKLQKENIPIVFFDRNFEGLNISSVVTNDFESGYLSALHLIKNGCQNPVFLSISSSLGICNKRAEGFRSALIEKKTGRIKNPVIICSGTYQEINSQIKKLLTGKIRPDGIIASVDRLAMSVYLICRETGISIPNELKVAVFSTMETAPILNPPLTTITQPAFEIGRIATELLFKKIEKKAFSVVDENIILPSFLIERTSTAAS